MSKVPSTLDDLPVAELLPVAFEHMLLGMLATTALLPQVVLAGASFDALNEVAIDEWMGASPVYTRRMRRLMGIEGDGVDAIMKALQLDVGFVHQYMSVGYRSIDDHHAEFWLDHCGALLNLEPHGEEAVFGMCHTIEDPTFDATAYATNPRARIRPIHRPPRVPADRSPHCHWTIEIDPTNEPVGPARLTEEIGALALASIPNERRPDHEATGRRDYSGDFDPQFRLAHLSPGTLAAAAREFQVQSHLLTAAGELALRDRFGEEQAREMLVRSWVGAGWIASERLAEVRGSRERGVEGLAELLTLHPALPPGFEREATIEGDRIRLRLAPVVKGLLDTHHPGWLGLLARGDTRGLAAMVHAIDPRARVEVEVSDRIVVTVLADAATEPVSPPSEVDLMRIGSLSTWAFEPGAR